MVLNFYRLAEQPFGVTPDARYLYLGETHREALASLLYGIQAGRGFTTLIAKPGMGKTTLLFQVLEKVKDTAQTVFLFQAQSTPRDFMQGLLLELGVDDDGTSLVRMQAKLNHLLMEEVNKGRRFVVVVDEAQNLRESVLEVVRMLSNFETTKQKLMQIILAGQPQLADKLASPSLLQLRQRISMVAKLSPFGLDETKEYIHHRLRMAGYDFESPLFTPRAYAMIAEQSEGIPRNINNLCFNALSIGCALKQRTIDQEVIQEVLRDLDLSPLGTAPAPPAQAQAAEVPPTTLFGSPIEPKRSFFSGRAARVGAIAATVAVAGGGFFVARNIVAGNMRTTAASEQKFVAEPSPKMEIPQSNSAPAPATPQVMESVPSTTPNESSQTASPVPTINAIVTSGPSSISTIPEEGISKISGTTRSHAVSANDTLYQITREHLGKYDEETLAQIRKLNPWLGDPNRIKVGQKIVLPASVGLQGSLDSKAGSVPATRQTRVENHP